MRAAEILVLLLAAIAVLATLAKRWTIPYPILLVFGGLVISFAPGLPPVELDPQLVLLIFMPPLLFAQAWATHWQDFCAYRRPILLLAVGLVLFTSTEVAFTLHALTGLPLAVGFVLGAIVSPPDAVAASAIAQRLGLPRRLVMILEGESLVNDATGLVAYRFGVAAVLTGEFSLAHASLQFVLVVLGGVALGWMIAWVSAKLFAKIDDPTVAITLSLLIPYIGYLSAERLQVSGVLAAVTSGLYLGWRAPSILSAATRLQATAVWEMLEFMLNSVIFILIGLQLPFVRARLVTYSLTSLLLYAAVICLVVIVVRPIWVFPGAYIPRWLSRRVRETEPHPSWQAVAVVSWSGMRGVVSLAAALALPANLPGGGAFPGRDLIVFLTFAVILATLVGQGLTLAPLIRWLGVAGEQRDEKYEHRIRLALAEAARKHLADFTANTSYPEAAITAVQAYYDERVFHLSDEQAHVLGWSEHREVWVARRRLRRETLAAERRLLIELRARGELTNEMLFALEHELDMEEERLR